MAHLQDRVVNIDGQPYTLRVSVKFFLALQELWKCDNDDQVRELIPERSTQLRGMIDLIYAALRTHHPTLTHAKVIDMMDGADLEGVAGELTNAMTAAAPPQNEDPPLAGQGEAPNP